MAARFEHRRAAHVVAGTSTQAVEAESGRRGKPLIVRPPRNIAAVSFCMAAFLDSHSHLADPAFEADVDAVVARAIQTGAVGIVCIGESMAAARRAQAIAARYPEVLRFTAGVHPHDAATFDPVADVAAIRRFVGDGAVAIGECGLDYHYDHSPRHRQRDAFSAQLDLARELQRPIVVHTREAEADTGQMIAEAARAGVIGVLHCFTGSVTLARAALDAGWYISFSGIVTFKKWTDDDLLRLPPNDRLLVESDAPYLAPVPHRGKRNEPAWVSFTVARIAAARDVDPAQLGTEAIRNARRFFGWA